MKKKAAVVSEMDADEIADLLRQMDKKERETLTELLDEEVRHKIDLIDLLMKSRLETGCPPTMWRFRLM